MDEEDAMNCLNDGSGQIFIVLVDVHRGMYTTKLQNCEQESFQFYSFFFEVFFLLNGCEHC